jgi:predicted Zn-dependent protease
MKTLFETPKTIALIFIFIALCFLTACSPNKNPVPIGVIPEVVPVSPTDEQYGHEAMTNLAKEYELDYTDPNYQRLVDIVEKLSTAINAKQEPWHVFLFNAPNVQNAGATRGNHIFVWSGILQTVQKDSELAAILAHEMAHIVAQHVANSGLETTQALINVASILVGAGVTVAIKNPTLANNAGDVSQVLTNIVGNELFTNAYSRENEIEADHIGLMIMAKAKYNPEDAINYWKRVEQDANMVATMKYFSTHPTTRDRVISLEKALPPALIYYQGGTPSPLYNTKTSTIVAQQAQAPVDSNLVSTKKSSAKSLNKQTSNIMLTDDTKLYRSPTANSPQVGQLKAGEQVTISNSLHGWLEVSEPQFGYIKK